MIYEYLCTACKHRFDVIKSVKDIERNENCPRCGEFGVRKFVPSRMHLANTGVQHAEFNPAFGCIVKNKRHRDELAKRRGMVEIGNDYKSGEAIQKEMEAARERKREARWEKDD